MPHGARSPRFSRQFPSMHRCRRDQLEGAWAAKAVKDAITAATAAVTAAVVASTAATAGGS